MKKFWEKWNKSLNRFGEWLVIGSIGAMSLEPLPGVLVLFFIVIFFALRQGNQPREHIKEYHALKAKKVEDLSPKEFDIFFEYLTIQNGEKRNITSYLLGCMFWLGSLLYLIFGKAGLTL